MNDHLSFTGCLSKTVSNFFLLKNSASLLKIISKLLIKNENTSFFEDANKQLKSADNFS